ncbi:MAG: UvrD-helicase domain-containing protein, partial [Desulfovibrio sp.]|nr:UvrD-helicase domain-containing protein [Desulfovibrio sp.]
MQEYLADLHIHSRFSRATSRKLGVPLLAAWARLKGISVLGTGDFTHPRWRDELREHLRYDEASGLYALADPASPLAALPDMPHALLRDAAPGLPVRFMPQGEISSIYKRGGKVRKVHNLVFMPNFEVAEAFCRKLETIGNLNADGRPILGLDSRDLLELVLESHPQAFLIPAHIWTPWFSLFGSRSGFDSLEDCFGDLSSSIFALETGLSSDPAMNRLWSALDGFRLVSNSDAHSGDNLGREANVFAGDVSYSGILNALKRPEASGGTRFLGTLEFFPEEGKYHMDGHRKCNVVLSPAETRELGGLCPVCGAPLTIGVLNRVMELSDRSEPVYQPGDGSDRLGGGGFMSLVPLPEVLGELLGVGAKSRKVGDTYAAVLERFGPELTVLRDVPETDLARYSPPLAEALARMRRGEVLLQGGFDGEYGTVKMFSEAERADLRRGAGSVRGRVLASSDTALGLSLPGTAVQAPARPPKQKRQRQGDAEDEDFLFSSLDAPSTPLLSGRQTAPDRENSVKAVAVEAGGGRPEPAEAGPATLNREQERAVLAGPGPVLVLAGPGTGKTRTLIARALHLLDEGIGARRIVGVTFTRRAATEMDARMQAALGDGVSLPRTDTLHALALELWHKTHADVPVLLSEESARRVFAEANPDASGQALREGWAAVNMARERLAPPPPEFADMGERYAVQKNAWNLADYTDLLEFWIEQTASGLFKSPWTHVLVDEIQDLSPLQLGLVRSLLSASGDGFFG